MQNERDVDVVVIGGGPVGVTALALLGRAGVSAIGFDRDEGVWPSARAVHFDGESFRTLQSLGVAERFIDATLPMSSFHIENEEGDVLLSYPTGRLGDQGWHDDLNFHQPDVERLIRDVVTELPGVELRSRHSVTSVENVADGVVVTTIDADGVESSVKARWAIAADGARSEVRHALGIPAEKFGEDAQWLVVDGHLIDSPGLQDDMIFLARHSRPALWVRLPGSRVRMEFMLMPGDDPEEIVTAAAIERLSRGVLPTNHFTADRAAIYTFRARVAETWRVGNIFLAGDAAHQAPPLFGQGLCAGMRDAANLVWKLDHVRRGIADESLLDTYESERKPHAQFWVEQATEAAGFVQTTIPEVARQRDAFLKANPAAAAPIIPALGPGLHDGPGDDRAGRLSVQPLLADGSRLDDHVGGRFLIATTAGLFEEVDESLRRTAAADDDIAVILDDEKVAPILEATGGQAVVIRPDRYIVGIADAPGDLERLIRTIPSVAHTAPAAATV